MRRKLLLGLKLPATLRRALEVVKVTQLDMNIPERFDLTCVNEKGERERIVMIHSAITGSLERCIAVLLEHLGGTLPLWLSPIQMRVLPISERHVAYATEITGKLLGKDIRAELDASNETLGKRIRLSKTEKVPYTLVVGDEEMKSETATIEGRDGNKESLPIQEIILRLRSEIESRV